MCLCLMLTIIYLLSRFGFWNLIFLKKWFQKPALQHLTSCHSSQPSPLVHLDWNLINIWSLMFLPNMLQAYNLIFVWCLHRFGWSSEPWKDNIGQWLLRLSCFPCWTHHEACICKCQALQVWNLVMHLLNQLCVCQLLERNYCPNFSVAVTLQLLVYFYIDNLITFYYVINII